MGEIGEDIQGNRYWRNGYEMAGRALYEPRSQAERDAELVLAAYGPFPIDQETAEITNN